jgi:hypothetical protein
LTTPVFPQNRQRWRTLPEAAWFPISAGASLSARRLHKLPSFMKFFVLLGPLLLAFFAARADDASAAAEPQSGLIIEEKLESKIFSSAITMKIKGNMARIDSATSDESGKSISSETVICDLSSGKVTGLLAGEKVAMEMDFTDLKKQTTTMLQGAAVEEPKATGAREKIGNWNADVYEWSGAGIKAKYWRTMDIPDTALVKEKLRLLCKVTAGLGPDPTQLDRPGVNIKTGMTSPQVGTVITTVINIRKVALADSEFVIPADYRKQAAPKAPEGKQKQ